MHKLIIILSYIRERSITNNMVLYAGGAQRGISVGTEPQKMCLHTPQACRDIRSTKRPARGLPQNIDADSESGDDLVDLVTPHTRTLEYVHNVRKDIHSLKYSPVRDPHFQGSCIRLIWRFPAAVAPAVIIAEYNRQLSSRG